MRKTIGVYEWQTNISKEALRELPPWITVQPQLSGEQGRLKGAVIRWSTSERRDACKAWLSEWLVRWFGAEHVEFWQELGNPQNYYATFDYNGRQKTHAR